MSDSAYEYKEIRFVIEDELFTDEVDAQEVLDRVIADAKNMATHWFNSALRSARAEAYAKAVCELRANEMHEAAEVVAKLAASDSSGEA